LTVVAADQLCSALLCSAFLRMYAKEGRAEQSRADPQLLPTPRIRIDPDPDTGDYGFMSSKHYVSVLTGEPFRCAC